MPTFEPLGLDHVVLCVRDQVVSLRFYTEIPRLHARPRQRALCLVQRFGQHLIDLLPGRRGEAGLDPFCLSIRCRDLAAVREELAGPGYAGRRGAFGGGPSAPYNRGVRRKKSRRRRAPAVPAAARLEQRALPIVRELARVARGTDPPRVKLEGALEILFGAYGESDPEYSGQFLAGWIRARQDKQVRLTMAWQREQLRLSLQDILTEGAAAGAFRRDLDPGAVAAVILGAAEGCLLQAATDGGPVAAEQLVRTLLRLAVTGA